MSGGDDKFDDSLGSGNGLRDRIAMQRYRKSGYSAPSTAVSTVKRLKGPTVFPEKTVPTRPPAIAPIRPMRIAIEIPPAAGPGINFLAIDPVASPTTIHKKILIAISVLPHIGLLT
jgi:hypothetical protein